jgi:LPS export ABC transporter protein LptC
MQEIRPRKKVSGIGLRAFAPKAVRVAALLVLVAGVGAVVVSYLRLKDRPVFRLRSGPAQLSKEVVGVVENFERRETKPDGRLHVFLRATRDVRFSDGHHELENLHLEVYPDEGDHPDKIASLRTVTNEDITQLLFTGQVQIETRDRLVAQTEAAEYDTKTQVGNITAPVVFSRENVSGRADAATLESQKKQLALRGNVEVTVRPDAEGQPAAPGVVPSVNLRGLPVTVKGAQALFEQAALKLSFTGGATAEQGTDLMAGDTLTGFLNEQKRVRFIEARGSAHLRTLNPGRSAEVFAAEMFFHFEDQKLTSARAVTNVRALTLDADSEAVVNAPASAELHFAVQGERSLLRSMRADGRAVLTLAAPKSKAGDPRAAHKKVTGDTVRLFWRDGGRDLERAEVEGKSELVVEPAHPTPEADRKLLFAERFDADFYEAGNLARHFKASGGEPRAVVEPLQPAPNRQTRTLSAPLMTAQFVRDTQDVERVEARDGARFQEGERTLTAREMTAAFGAQQALDKVDAAGDAKFNERDRNGQSAAMSYTARDEVVRLRGGEPVVWDSRARLKANEIDSDARQKISYGRGRVQTTYYSQEQTGGAAPFRNAKSPVFIASNAAEFQHDARVGIYTGAAKAWQDDNFIRAERITLRDVQKRMDAEGRVESALYNARRKEPSGERVVVPVFATSARMSYSDPERVLHYEEDVDIKQGTERITAGVADVYLMKDTYEAERTVAQRQVVVTQPGRRGLGDWAQYTAADETVVLTGNPARVEDAEKGHSESRRMIVHLRDNSVTSDAGPGKQATGRVRSTHKIKKQ